MFFEIQTAYKGYFLVCLSLTDESNGNHLGKQEGLQRH